MAHRAYKISDRRFLSELTTAFDRVGIKWRLAGDDEEPAAKSIEGAARQIFVCPEAVEGAVTIRVCHRCRNRLEHMNGQCQVESKSRRPVCDDCQPREDRAFREKHRKPDRPSEREPLTVLGLPESIVDLLPVDCRRVDELRELARGNVLMGLTGIGPERQAVISAALAKYWTENEP